MGKIASKLMRPIKNFNVENRAQRVLQSEKPRPAPRHPSTIAALEREAKEHPDYLKEQKIKHEKLNEFLKQIRVESTGVNTEIRAKTDRSLPENRSKAEPSEYGFPDPDRIPEGKASLRQALGFISQHYMDPTTHTAQVIAEQYKLDVGQVTNVLLHFQILHMHIPKEMLKKNPKLLQALQARPVQQKKLTDFAASTEPARIGHGNLDVDAPKKH